MGGVGASFLAIPWIAVVAASTGAAGRRLATRLLPDATPPERSVLGFPIGMGLLTLLMTGLLFARVPAGALPAVLVAVLLPALLWARSDVREILLGLRGFVRESPVLAAAVGVSALFALVGCLAPETGWDTGVYHFTVARLRAEQGGLVGRLDIPYGFRPGYMESLYTAGFALNGETLASLVNASFYFGGFALARLWGAALGGERGGFFAGLAWLTPWTYVLRTDGGDVEVGQAVYLGTVLFALQRLREGGGPGWRVLAGAGMGMLLGVKYSSGYALVVFGVAWLAVRGIDRTSWRTMAADGLVFGLLAGIIGCPWFVRNHLTTGSFIFPYAATQAGTFWESTARENSAGLSTLLQTVWRDGFVFVGIVALALPGGARLRWAGLASVLTGVWLHARVGMTAAAISNGWRYGSLGWMPLLVAGGLAVAGGVHRGGAWRVFALGLLGAALAVGQGLHVARNVRKIPVALGIVSREAYLESRINTYRAIRDAEASLPPGKKLLLVEERGYYCRAPFLTATDIQHFVEFDRLKTASDVRRFLQDERIGAIVVDRSPEAKIWTFRNLERRLGPEWPVPGVRPLPVRGEASLYLVD